MKRHRDQPEREADEHLAEQHLPGRHRRRQDPGQRALAALLQQPEHAELHGEEQEERRHPGRHLGLRVDRVGSLGRVDHLGWAAGASTSCRPAPAGSPEPPRPGRPRPPGRPRRRSRGGPADRLEDGAGDRRARVGEHGDAGARRPRRRCRRPRRRRRPPPAAPPRRRTPSRRACRRPAAPPVGPARARRRPVRPRPRTRPAPAPCSARPPGRTAPSPARPGARIASTIADRSRSRARKSRQNRVHTCTGSCPSVPQRGAGDVQEYRVQRRLGHPEVG